jgi:molybdopterin converting factor small subunit
VTIRIKTFAVLKSYFQDEFEIQIEDESNILDVLEHLDKLNPKASHVLSHSLIAIDERMVDKSTKLQEGNLVCILPPVSGG